MKMDKLLSTLLKVVLANPELLETIIKAVLETLSKRPELVEHYLEGIATELLEDKSSS
jgi:hypothetical protein